MFTDSSFYNSKYHPTIADQVEMAHKLSSAMFTEQNKASKGAKMYLTRMENSGQLPLGAASSSSVRTDTLIPLKRQMGKVW